MKSKMKKTVKLLILFILFSLFLLVSLFFKNNSEIVLTNRDALKLSYEKKKKERFLQLINKKENEINKLKESGCVELMVDNKIFDLKNEEINLTKIPEQIICQKWEIKHLKPPRYIHGLYYPSFAILNSYRKKNLYNLVNQNKINSVVIDIKEVDGKVAFDMSKFKFGKIKPKNSNIIKNPKKLIEELHKRGIYTIARIVVFKDKILAEKRPDLALQLKNTHKVWTDRGGKKYLDPNSKEVWEYIKNIARAAYLTGFDEINFDYVRYPSDGALTKIYYPKSEKNILADEKWARAKILDEFFNYLTTNLRKEFPDIQLSADLFGQTVLESNDLKIGQIFEDALLYFDRVGPMTYPSHYNPHFIGLNTADSHPYKVIDYNLKKINQKIKFINQKIDLAKKNKKNIELRKGFVVKKKYQELEKISKKNVIPWYQAFSCTWCKNYIPYGKKQIEAQIKAGEKNGYENWFFWNAAGFYSRYF